MKILKIRETKTPIRSTNGSAGIDFFVPNDFLQSDINPGKSLLIPSGIKAKVPDNFALIAFNKSGISTKKNLIVGACVVDSDYQGEIHIHVINVGKNRETIKPGDKLIQFILLPYNNDKIDIVETEEILFNNFVSERGEGGFGHTGSN